MAQQKVVGTVLETQELNANQLPQVLTETVQDTLIPTIFTTDTCANSVFLYSSQQGGFVGGVNNYGDKQKCEILQVATPSGSFMVREIWGFFGPVTVGNDGPSFANAYTIGTNGPDQLAGVSDTVLASEINYVAGQVLPTIYSYSTPITVTGTEFAACIDFSQLYPTLDTVGLFSTEIGCADSLTAWEQWSDNTWIRVGDGNSWDIDLNFMIFSIVEFDTATSSIEDQFMQKGNITLYPAYPNPATDMMTLSFELNSASNLRIEMYDAMGRMISNTDKGISNPGKYEIPVSVSTLPAGNYIYGIVTDEGRIMTRFTVN